MNNAEWRSWLAEQLREAAMIIDRNAEDFVGDTPFLMDFDITIRCRQSETTTIELMRTTGVPISPEVKG